MLIRYTIALTLRHETAHYRPFISIITSLKKLTELQENRRAIIENIEQKSSPVATVGFAAVQKTAYDFPQQEEACQEGDYDLVAALVGVSAKISPFGQVLFQFFHETGPENESR